MPNPHTSVRNCVDDAKTALEQPSLLARPPRNSPFSEDPNATGLPADDICLPVQAASKRKMPHRSVELEMESYQPEEWRNTQDQTLFAISSEEQIARVLKAVQEAIRTKSDPDLSACGDHLVLHYYLHDSLPIRLQPWKSTLDRWSKKTRSTLATKRISASVREHGSILITGPSMPKGHLPWLASVGIDPGETRNETVGFTSLLLFCAPSTWAPSPIATLRGRYGERDIARLDGLLMRIPKAWWDDWSVGAYSEGALYQVEVVE